VGGIGHDGRMDESLHANLRAWALGMRPLTAATEMLIQYRGGHFAMKGRRWIKIDSDGSWVDFKTIPDNIGVLSGGEQRFLMIAASIGGEEPVDLSWALSGIDHEATALVHAAIAYIHDETPFSASLAP
jgi:hypothetical protein